MYERILVPLDGSELAELALPHAQALAAKFGSQVTLLRAVPTFTEALQEVGTLHAADVSHDVATRRVETEKNAASDYLGSIASRWAGVETRVAEGAPAAMILDVAGQVGASLIVMSTHGRGGLGRLVFGSVADSVLRHSTVPVLLVRPPK